MRNVLKVFWEEREKPVNAVIVMGLTALIVAAAFSALALAILGNH